MAHPHPGEHPSTRVVTITVSDTRTVADDTSGTLLQDELRNAGCTIVRHAIVPDEPNRVRAEILRAIDHDAADAVVSTGGTGIAPRDLTYEAVVSLLDKTLDGFGEAFRRLSWDEIGARAILSRAVAGTHGRALIFCLPGSTKAVRLGVTQLIVPVLGHAVTLAKG